jgi:hypothetical protein
MREKRLSKIIGISLVLTCIFIASVYAIFHNSLFEILESQLSVDQTIKPATIIKVDFLYYTIVFLLTILGFLIFFAPGFISRIIHVLISDPVCPRNKPVTTLVFTLLIGLVLSVLFNLDERTFLGETPLFDAIFRINGVLDIIDLIVLFLSVVLLVRAFFYLRKNLYAGFQTNLLPVICLMLALAAFFLVMEEISWGQDLFHWQTPQEVFAGNIENETNIHNFLNNYFIYLYPATGILILLVTLIPVIAELVNRSSDFIRLILPHPSLLGCAAWIALHIGPGREEVLELLLGFFILFYSIRINRCKQSIKQPV